MKKLVLVLSLLGFSSAAIACQDKENTTAAAPQKSSVAAKSAKKAPRTDAAKKHQKKS